MNKKFSALPTKDKVLLLQNFLEEHQGQDIVHLDLSAQSAFAEAMIVVTARSMRHAQSLAEAVQLFCKEHNFEFLRIEGKQLGQWILLDLNDVVIHIFQASVRDLYKLEQLWQELPKTALASEHVN